MKHVDYMLHSYFESLHELNQLGRSGGTIIGKAMQDGGSGDPVFCSRVPTGVEMSPKRQTEENRLTRLALFRLEHHNEAWYLALRACYQFKIDGGRRTDRQSCEMLGMKLRTYERYKSFAKYWLRDYFRDGTKYNGLDK